MCPVGDPGYDAALRHLRRICLALPEVTERLSHGEPTWFVRGKKTFVTFANRHHDDRVAFWCAAGPDVQATLVAQAPEQYFRPPYVGHRGWLGVELAGVSTAELTAICREAFLTVAPATVRRLLES